MACRVQFWLLAPSKPSCISLLYPLGLTDRRCCCCVTVPRLNKGICWGLGTGSWGPIFLWALPHAEAPPSALQNFWFWVILPLTPPAFPGSFSPQFREDRPLSLTLSKSFCRINELKLWKKKAGVRFCWVDFCVLDHSCDQQTQSSSSLISLNERKAMIQGIKDQPQILLSCGNI
jgi:hypothetical protein